jgi:hypothetical protein
MNKKQYYLITLLIIVLGCSNKQKVENVTFSESLISSGKGTFIGGSKVGKWWYKIDNEDFVVDWKKYYSFDSTISLNLPSDFSIKQKESAILFATTADSTHRFVISHYSLNEIGSLKNYVAELNKYARILPQIRMCKLI